MLDLPENEIRGSHKINGLIGFVNLLKDQNNQTLSFSNHAQKQKIDVDPNVIGSAFKYKKTENKEDQNEEEEKTEEEESEDVVNYKVGRLVMSILKEFKVGNILERFEKVLVENVKTPDSKIDKELSPITVPSVTASHYKRRKYSPKNYRNITNHRGICLTIISLTHLKYTPIRHVLFKTFFKFNLYRRKCFK